MPSTPSCRFRHAALVGKYQARGIRPILEDVAHLLARAGLDVSLESETAYNTGMTEYPALSIKEIGQQCDVAVVLGGDGTMLAIARELAPFNIPLIGINQGRLGFITDIPLKDVGTTLPLMLRGEYEEDRRAMLAGAVLRPIRGDGFETIYEGFAINEVLVSRGATASMVELRAEIDGQFVANYRADGLLVSSPTGSTAYAMSAGGPIMHPGVGGWVIVPIASHTLSNRPLVVSDDVTITIEIVAGKDAGMNFDMQSLASLLHGDRVIVRRSDHHVRFLHPKGWSYYATLRRKLRWNEGVS
ncbi:MAG: NAD kinase [Burkholderiales bacterium RIFCSPLOWO2_12_FULL_64_99]|uniref:NAD kinase n=1 Tax=Aquabacterium sp. TaxID=1872578 RepID=UPI0008C36DAA|nr:NAD kinase [Aquabacterium sp.]OGB03996.1 MAG: NAD kinase [Burkholderiales bacterium RIFCSPHIGHO2_12_FULL_63_20]OGB66756.1 MAG: NAD kinase [Burkholderiales bacterium RIFCSPLOWO2_12_FULL_64_99]